MKKMYIVLMLIIFCLSSCNIIRGDKYIDLDKDIIAENFYKSLSEYSRLYNEYENEKVVYECYDMQLFGKNNLSKEKYEELVEFYGFEFENSICLVLHLYTENGIETRYKEQIFQFRSSKAAKKVYDEFYTGNISIVLQNNIIYRDCYAVQLLLGQEVDKRYNIVLNNDGNILYSGIEFKGPLNVLSEIKEISFGAFRRQYVTKLVCNSELEEIAVSAFAFNEELSVVHLNDTLKYIGSSAFYGCNKLEWIVIPQSVVFIGDFTFSNGKIFCEVIEKPNNWSEYFVTENAKVYWKGEWKYDENGIPTPIKVEEQLTETK